MSVSPIFRFSALFAVFAGVTAFAAFAAAQGRTGARLATFERAPLSVVAKSGTHYFTVELARTPRQHSQGLMFRRRLARDAGMLFIYRIPAIHSMWMKNTLLPLDMLFIAGDGRIVRIAERTVPRSLETISSGVPVTGVLEVLGGTVSRLKIAVGDRVVHPAFPQSR